MGNRRSSVVPLILDIAWCDMSDAVEFTYGHLVMHFAASKPLRINDNEERMYKLQTKSRRKDNGEDEVEGEEKEGASDGESDESVFEISLSLV